MFLYVIFAIIAGIVQVATVYYLRAGVLKSFLWAIPFILLHQYLFLYNYTKAPNFLIIWFLTVAVTSTLSFIVGYFILKDPVTTYQLIGIALIMIGVVFLKF